MRNRYRTSNLDRDTLDARIMEILKQDGRIALSSLAQRTGVSTLIARKTIQRLLDDKVIHIGAVVDPATVGLPIATILTLKVETDKWDTVIQQLIKHVAVNTVAKMTGRFDVFAFLRFRDMDEFSRFMQSELDNMEGVIDVEASLCLQITRGRFTFMNTEMIDSPHAKLISLLQKNGRDSSENIAKELQVNSSTVRRTIQALISSKRMRITATVDPIKTGKPIVVAMGLDVIPKFRKDVVRTLAFHTEVEFISKTTGRFDVILITRFEDNKKMTQFLKTVIATVPGIKNSETFIVFDLYYGGMYGAKMKPAAIWPDL
jgi:Lrp/AsnC family transcriptional regulator, regulator for asnA, asnC and gidA